MQHLIAINSSVATQYLYFKHFELIHLIMPTSLLLIERIIAIINQSINLSFVNYAQKEVNLDLE